MFLDRGSMNGFGVNERFEKLLYVVREMKNAKYERYKISQMSNEELRMRIMVQCGADLSDDMLSSVRKAFGYLQK